MQFICPKCYARYLTPGKCWLCGEVLQPVPQVSKVIQTIVNDPKALAAALELANTVIKKLL